MDTDCTHYYCVQTRWGKVRKTVSDRGGGKEGRWWWGGKSERVSEKNRESMYTYASKIER